MYIYYIYYTLYYISYWFCVARTASPTAYIVANCCEKMSQKKVSEGGRTSSGVQSPGDPTLLTCETPLIFIFFPTMSPHQLPSEGPLTSGAGGRGHPPPPMAEGFPLPSPNSP